MEQTSALKGAGAAQQFTGPEPLRANGSGWISSSRARSCPVCGRDTDGDCRQSGDGQSVVCHRGTTFQPPANLKPGERVAGKDGQQWAYTGDTSDGRAAHFTIDKPRPGSNGNGHRKLELPGRYRGHWPRIWSDLLALPAEIIDNQWRDCPLCGTAQAFKAGPSAYGFHVICNACGGSGNGGLIASIELAARVLGTDINGAKARIDAFLGLEPTPAAPPAPPAAISLARLPVPRTPPPAHWPNNTTLAYGPDQRVRVIVRDTGKEHRCEHRSNGKWIRKAGPEPWPLWMEAEALAHGPGKWIVEAEGEKCADWARAGGLVAVSQPGHAMRGEAIVERYSRLKAAGIAGVVYVSDNDNEGARKAETCRKAAAAALLPYIHLPAAKVWPGLPEKGSIDDAPGTAAERVAAVEASLKDLKPEIAQEQAPPSAAGGRRVRLRPDDVLSLLPQRVGRLRLNVRTGDVHSPAGVLSGNQISRLYLELSNVAETWPKEATTDAVMYLAHRDQFDPVREWLEGLEVEPLPMEQWEQLDKHLLGIDDPIARKALPRYLIGAIARTMEPGCYVRQTPVLIGPQERGKTELGRILFGVDHWVEGVGALDRDALQRAGTAWGVELAELDGVTRRRDQEQLKAFLTECIDTYQIRYDRCPEKHPRRFVFWATANRPPLRDSTGSTRFVCIPIPDRMLPLDWAGQHRDALWARALQQYLAGVTWLRTDEQERREVEERNSEFIQLDPWADEIAKYLAAALKPDQIDQIPVTVPSLLERLNVPKERQNNAMADRVRQIAESLGWQHGRRRWNGSKNKVAGLFPPQDPGHPAGHPGHPAGHPTGTPADPNQRNGSGPVGHPGHPISSKGSEKREERQREQAAATGPVELQRVSRRVDAVSGCPGCPPHQTDCGTSDLLGGGGVTSGVTSGVPRGAQPAPITVGSLVAKWSKADRRHLPGWVVLAIDGDTATVHRPGSPGRCTCPLDQLVVTGAT